MPVEAVIVLLVVLSVFDWITFALLRKAARAGARIQSLESRTRITLLIALSSTLAVLLGLNGYVHVLPDSTPWIVLVVIVTLPSLGNIWFLVDLSRGKFRVPDSPPVPPTDPG